jgi:dihydrofolate reductase/thymidylate synthase
VKETFVIGGQSLYEEAISEPFRDLCKSIIVTRINKDFESDVKMPPFED